ncbi:MAG: hypothetical protein V7L31_26370 [Nostoc sp.]
MSSSDDFSYETGISIPGGQAVSRYVDTNGQCGAPTRDVMLYRI